MASWGRSPWTPRESESRHAVRGPVDGLIGTACEHGGMARWELADGRLRLRLSTVERIVSLRGADLDFDSSTIVSVEDVDNAWPHLHGIRAPGAGIPDLLCVGTLRHHGVKDFTAVYGRGAATVVTLRDCEFARVIVSGQRPVAIA